MTPLQTPPPVSALQAAPPALKQQNPWIMDESHDDGMDATPSVSFPLLMPQRSMPSPPRMSAILSHEQTALPAPSLQPQSLEFLKFPSLKRENKRDSCFSAAAAPIPQPIPIRPLSECFRGRSPSLQLIIDNELNEVPSENATTNRVHHRPQLRIQPLKSGGAATPSHLARRGAEERTYLESQLRAESSLRRNYKNQWQNNEEMRKAREKIVFEDDEDGYNDEISALMEKFRDFQLNNEHGDCLQRWLPARKKRLPGSNRENVAPSPPIILQKSLKRSVSDVIADSRGQDDDDACVLFFPDGLPLVDECNEIMSRNNSLASLENCNSFDSCSKCGTMSPNTHDVTEGSTPFGTLSCHSTPNSVECQQPVLGGEVDCGSGHFLKNTKKLMLRPKMTVRPKTPARLTRSEEEKAEGTVPDQIDFSSRLFDIECPDNAGFSAIPDQEESFVSLEADAIAEAAVEDAGPNFRRSFQRLDSDATIVRKNGALDEALNCAESFECPKSATEAADCQGWNYSSPEPIRRSQFRANGSILLPPKVHTQEITPIEPFQLVLREPLSESNYCTPDQSNCIIRKQLAVKRSGVLDTLPELFLPSLNKISQPPSFDDDLSGVAKRL